MAGVPRLAVTRKASAYAEGHKHGQANRRDCFRGQVHDGVQVNDQDDRSLGNIRIRAPSIMSLPGVSQRKEADGSSAPVSRTGTDMVSVLATRKPRLNFEDLPAWASQETGADPLHACFTCM